MILDAGQVTAGGRFLSLLADASRHDIDGSRVMAVFAHPDDETIAMGGQLARLRGIRLIHVTDGAPANMADAVASGFSCREDYAAARQRELIAAVAEAGIPREALLALGAADQSAAFHLTSLSRLVAEAFRLHETELVITHAYEGGHPDHDATAFIVHAACRMLHEGGAPAPGIIECPLYHARHGRWALQEFALFPRVQAPELRIKLVREATETKRRMLSAHTTQQSTLTQFACTAERFRPAPHYDFSRLPNGGELLYERFDWGLDGKTWLRLSQDARRELGLPRWF